MARIAHVHAARTHAYTDARIHARRRLACAKHDSDRAPNTHEIAQKPRVRLHRVSGRQDIAVEAAGQTSSALKREELAKESGHGLDERAPEGRRDRSELGRAEHQRVEERVVKLVLDLVKVEHARDTLEAMALVESDGAVIVGDHVQVHNAALGVLGGEVDDVTQEVAAYSAATVGLVGGEGEDVAAAREAGLHGGCGEVGLLGVLRVEQTHLRGDAAGELVHVGVPGRCPVL
eukprot:CAMPEP_0202094134 /NCGR_PEP_ID=MMETSP0964-20121228/48891_1 /ASSEMBLY_ACC=CAM_ASM_000500 /TAXON_ID=4773 /ORGANISM="Schizochytrium aggregatum, Strain ATCC28209" /LENGTH=232 /DNA_ID=CAMNT_0048662387 /DNA_START=319 /DNA_END=1018 /DNA_ORIENTATION=+